jgi:hypothetical protein
VLENRDSFSENTTYGTYFIITHHKKWFYAKSCKRFDRAGIGPEQNNSLVLKEIKQTLNQGVKKGRKSDYNGKGAKWGTGEKQTKRASECHGKEQQPHPARLYSKGDEIRG